MITSKFKRDLTRCISRFVNEAKKIGYAIDPGNVEIYINDGYLTLRYENDETMFCQEVEEINDELRNMNFIVIE